MIRSTPDEEPTAREMHWFINEWVNPRDLCVPWYVFYFLIQGE